MTVITWILLVFLVLCAAAVVVLYRLFRRLEARYGKAPSKPLEN